MTSTGIEALLYMKTNNSVSSDRGYPDIEILQSFATPAFDTSNFPILDSICHANLFSNSN